MTLKLCLVPVFCIIHHVHWLLRFVQRGTWPKNHLPAGNWYDTGTRTLKTSIVHWWYAHLVTPYHIFSNQPSLLNCCNNLQMTVETSLTNILQYTCLAERTGLEPATPAWQAGMLTSYTNAPKMEEWRSEGNINFCRTRTGYILINSRTL